MEGWKEKGRGEGNGGRGEWREGGKDGGRSRHEVGDTLSTAASGLRQVLEPQLNVCSEGARASQAARDPGLVFSIVCVSYFH